MRRTLFSQLSVLFCLCLVLSLPLVSAETFSLTYDDNGNLVNGQYFDYTYNALNQLTEVRDTAGNLIEEYTYDGDGNRVRKIEHFSDGTSETTYYPFPELVRKVDATGTEDTYYYFYDGDIIARDDPDGSRKYYHNDHLGSHTLVTDQSGAVVEETTYKPFGGVWTGGEADFLYTGKELDETNLYYYGARYYDPELRKFTQPDTIIQDEYNPQSLNRYAYVLNNPYKYTDPSGHIVDVFLDLGFIGYDLYNIWNNPTSGWNWAALGADIATAAIPFAVGGGLAIKGIAKVDDVASVGSLGRKALSGEREIQQIPIDKLYGHATDNPTSLFREGAKTHQTDPLEVIRIGEEYMISDGVGRSMRASKSGETFVYSKVIREYQSVNELNKAAKMSDTARVDKHWWNNLVSKINDPKRWEKLQRK